MAKAFGYPTAADGARDVRFITAVIDAGPVKGWTSFEGVTVMLDRTTDGWQCALLRATARGTWSSRSTAGFPTWFGGPWQCRLSPNSARVRWSTSFAPKIPADFTPRQSVGVSTRSSFLNTTNLMCLTINSKTPLRSLSSNRRGRLARHSCRRRYRVSMAVLRRVELLGGAWFKTHPRCAGGNRRCRRRGHHPAMVGLPARTGSEQTSGTTSEANPRRNAVHVLASVDESTYSPRAPMVRSSNGLESIAVGDGTGAVYGWGAHG